MLILEEFFKPKLYRPQLMSLFQHSVLNKYLKEIHQDEVKEAYEKLVSYFHNPVRQQNIRDCKEEEYQGEFLAALFVDVFGYTAKPNPNYNLTREFKNETGPKKADGAILNQGFAIGVIELKSTKIKELDAIQIQAFNYKANQSKCIYVITSNFEKVRFYINNAVDYEEFDLFKLSYDRFQLMWLCLAKENVFRNTPLKIKEDSVVKEEKVTKQIYKDYSAFKSDLYNDLVKNNLYLEIFSGKEEKEKKLILFKKSQKLLDRFLFIFFGEDRGLLPPNSITNILTEFYQLQKLDEYRPLYERFNKHFNRINTGWKDEVNEIFQYNGGLFAPDEILDNIQINDAVLIKHSKVLTAYDFETEIDVNILGHIFENSLNEIEEVTAEIEGDTVELKNSKRKKDGVFYTPKYITKYIVENTVGKLCEEKKTELGILNFDYDKDFKLKSWRTIETVTEVKVKGEIKHVIEKRKTNISIEGSKQLEVLNNYRNWLLSITICDPACGSGAFLNQALDFLIKEHNTITELSQKITGDVSTMFIDIENQILENNIYGVDINEESVEIAKLSLWLRTAQKGRKLTTLSNNIKCGNSLIDDPEVAEEKAFNWQTEFPEIFANGGFDVVIGNPPYGASFSEIHKRYITSHYKSFEYKFESYLYFYEKGIGILRNEGYLSFITPELFLRLEKSKNIRQFLLNEVCLNELKFCGENVFEDVKINSVILTLKKGERNTESFKIVPETGGIWNYEFVEWMKEPLLKIDYEISPRIRDIIRKIETNSIKLDNIGEAIQGLTPYDSYRGHSKELIKNRTFHVKEKVDESCGKWLDGKHVTRYYLSEGYEWLKYGDWLAAPREKRFFEGPRLLYREVPGQNKRIQATFAEDTYYHGHSITPFILENRSNVEDLYLILSITNSYLLSWFIKYKSANFSKNTFPKLNPKDIKDFPIPNNYKEFTEIGDKAKFLLKKHKELNDLNSKFLLLIQGKFEIIIMSRNLQNWVHLKNKDFLKELQKAKIKLSLSEEAEWLHYFNEQKQKAQAVKSDIEKIDREIDQMVYELYGLTEEEIGIVEESLN